MQVNHVTDTLSVSPQISPSDVTAIKEAGFKSIICNRPDGEENGQPTFSQVSAAALSVGLKITYQPINGANMGVQDAEQFNAELTSLPAPTLAYCRTGTRCIKLWAMSVSENMNKAEIISTAKKAGYDLSAFVDSYTK